LILLAFLLPLATYLLVLGAVNRRRHPLVIPGVWDFIGVLFAASGFLLFGGPAILSSLNERWRMAWLLGQSPGPAALDGELPVWVVLAAFYFVLVVAGAAYMLRRRRYCTAIYNVDAATVEGALAETFELLGLCPVRSGNLLLFGLAVGHHAGARTTLQEGIQGPHYLPPPPPEALRPNPRPAAGELAGQAAILEVDSFPPMHHVTLRWDPADPPLRHEVETALVRRLARTPAPDSELGGWLVLVGSTLLFGSLLGGTLLLLVRIFRF
jgi:hypothetical protein